jgi:putative endopeptidase
MAAPTTASPPPSEPAAGATGRRSGLDLSQVDPATRPQDDLYRHVSGRWLREHVMPADRAVDGAFRALHDQAERDVRAIVEEVAASGAARGTTEQRIGDLYAAFMDVERVDAAGADPVRPLLEEVAGAPDRSALAALLGRAEREGLTALVAAYVDTDAKDSTRYLVHLTQAGLGLPDESYYREEQHAPVRAAYAEHLARMAELLGLPAVLGLADGAAVAAAVLDLETAVAAEHWDVVANRDAERTYTLMSAEELAGVAAGFDWAAWRGGLGAGEAALAQVVVRQPSAVAGIAGLWAQRPLEQWKAWLALRIGAASAPYLAAPLVEENFAFYGRTLSGTQELRERWKRGIALVQGALGEAVGELYVARHFPAASKERMGQIVETLVEAYRQSIGELDWMGPETRERALAKLEAFTPKIGYPPRWKSYEGLDVTADDLLGDVRRSGALETDRDLAKLGRPVDRDEWFMTPQTVNAYYNPGLNEIVFPAAILQPPFFDAEADDAANYGGIGAVIGHEIGHGFDDQGSKYDGAGNLRDWWTAADREEFERRAAALVAQFSALSPAALPGHHVNGELTVGENIGDLGGLTIALKAYALALGGAEPPVLDGLTGLQRVFFGWAQVWRTAVRDEEALRRLAVDPHSPPELRCNAIVANIDAFHEAFGVGEGDALFLPAEERVRIW